MRFEKVKNISELDELLSMKKPHLRIESDGVGNVLKIESDFPYDKEVMDWIKKKGLIEKVDEIKLNQEEQIDVE